MAINARRMPVGLNCGFLPFAPTLCFSISEQRGAANQKCDLVVHCWVPGVNDWKQRADAYPLQNSDGLFGLAFGWARFGAAGREKRKIRLWCVDVRNACKNLVLSEDSWPAPNILATSPTGEVRTGSIRRVPLDADRGPACWGPMVTALPSILWSVSKIAALVFAVHIFRLGLAR